LLRALRIAHRILRDDLPGIGRRDLDRRVEALEIDHPAAIAVRKIMDDMTAAMTATTAAAGAAGAARAEWRAAAPPAAGRPCRGAAAGPPCGAGRRLRGPRILGPGVLGVPAAHLLAPHPVGPAPEREQIVGDRERPTGRGQQTE